MVSQLNLSSAQQYNYDAFSCKKWKRTHTQKVSHTHSNFIHNSQKPVIGWVSPRRKRNTNCDFFFPYKMDWYHYKNEQTPDRQRDAEREPFTQGFTLFGSILQGFWVQMKLIFGDRNHNSAYFCGVRDALGRDTVKLRSYWNALTAVCFTWL